MLARWYKEYEETGDLHKKYNKQPRYTFDQETNAVNYYIEHGRSISRTIRILGYPSRPTLREWIEKHAPNERKSRIRGGPIVQYSYEQKRDAVIELCVRKGAAAAVADAIGVSRYSLYKWRKELLGKEIYEKMHRPNNQESSEDRDALLAELSSLKEQVYRQQIELDILKKAAEILKKGQGIDPKELTNREKSSLIDALRTTYPLNTLLTMIEMPKSSYFYQREAQNKGDKYATLRTTVKEVFNENHGRYGYRRLHAIIRKSGERVSEKVIRRIMKEDKLSVPQKKRKYKSYLGEISPAVENIVNRDFHAEKPNTKWLTDLTEFHIPAGKAYLSPILDCFDGMPISWTIGTSPDAELVNMMLDGAIETLQEHEKPVIHSDRGCHYRWPGWIERMDTAGLTRSMSKKGCSPDNAACEGFFGSVKNEMFYFRSWQGVSMEQFIDELDGYLRWFRDKRIKMTLGAMSPMEYRRSLGITIPQATNFDSFDRAAPSLQTPNSNTCVEV
jgi:transposase InsO family protein/transposase-like protein